LCRWQALAQLVKESPEKHLLSGLFVCEQLAITHRVFGFGNVDDAARTTIRSPGRFPSFVID
jgi:hypothetical protein